MESSALLYNQLKTAEPFFLLAGPNVIESEEHIFRMAKHIKTIATKVGLPLVFKSSFDKANRTSSKSFRSPVMAEGLKGETSLPGENISLSASGKNWCIQHAINAKSSCYSPSLPYSLKQHVLSSPPQSLRV